ncbi:MAG: ATP-binding cassette domain-containing protein [Clostridiales bacterium]|jgi:putative ABC transport system ATP-binding protein|nr:ATP-binding cassette domain-containing protein [Clostridiales bacterium]
MLKLKKVTKVFNKGTINENVVLRDINLDINDGDFVSIIGSNGAGKSTLLNVIAGVFPVDDGSIILDDQDITRLPEYERAKFIGRVFQDPMMGTAPSMTIEENLSMACCRTITRGLRWGLNEKNRKEFKIKLAELGLGLENRMNTKVELLSGGQRQAITLLIATMVKPKLLLLDEHTAALDPSTVRLINDLTEEIVLQKGITTLMITHNMEYAIKMGNRLIMMDRGQVVLDIKGADKALLTVDELVNMFENAANKKFDDDRIMLGLRN